MFVDGRYKLLLPNHPYLYVYTRENESEKLLIAANISEHTVSFEKPEGNWSLLLGNYDDTENSTLFRPYEAQFIIWRNERGVVPEMMTG